MQLNNGGTGEAQLHSDNESRLGPSLYTTALIQASKNEQLPNGSACEIGVGSGICLLMLAQMGFGRLSGCDTNPVCVDATRQLLGQHASNAILDIKQGDLWDAFESPTMFSVVLANLPHFPGEPITTDEETRLPNWRGGNGRQIMDRFLNGLPQFLAPDGIGLITHHDLIGLDHTEQLLEKIGLEATCVLRWTVHESAARMASVSDPSLIDRCPTAHQLGPYWFMDSRVLRITHRQ